MRLTTRQIDWLNIGFMLASAAAAYVLPFEVFLFAYAVLGPLHYLTEISWLHERNYFATRRRDALWLFAISVGLFVVAFVVPWRDISNGRTLMFAWTAGLGYLAFLCALAIAVGRSQAQKMLIVCGGLLLLMGMINWPAYTLIFAVFLPTLIHVYVFTGLFILYGALKSRSGAGLLSLAVFLACPIVLMFWRIDTGYRISPYAQETYPLFQELNNVIVVLLGISPQRQAELNQAVYGSSAGIAIMRCIAFAYMYHYLNWFAKTSIIKWHLVSKRRLAGITLLWLASVGLYFYDYRVGFIALATLSFLHVFLEFPLNHKSVIGIVGELRDRWRAAAETNEAATPRRAVAASERGH